MPHPYRSTFRCQVCRGDLGTVNKVGRVSLLSVGERIKSLAVDAGRFGVVCADCSTVRPWTGGVVYATTAYAL